MQPPHGGGILVRNTKVMNLRHLTIAAATTCALTAAGFAVAQPMGWHHGGPGGGDMEFLHGLNLTDAQKDQAKTIEKSAWSQTKPLVEQLHTLHEQYVTTLLTANSTQAQAAAIQQQEESVHNQLDAAKLATAFQLRALLTPEQLSQAADLHSKLEALHQQERDAIEAARSSSEQ
jgi:Spy/CpxP family protein refolding chaperone